MAVTESSACRLGLSYGDSIGKGHVSGKALSCLIPFSLDGYPDFRRVLEEVKGRER
jgi:hypothetical protein